MQSHFRLKLLVASIALAAATSVNAVPTTQASSAFVALATQKVNTLRNGDVSTGPLAFSQPMHIVVSLKLRNKAQLDSFVAKAQQPGTAVADRSMSSAQFAAQYSPTQAQAQAVAAYLTRAGYTNVTIAPNRLLVEGDATSDTVRATFNTTFESVRTHDGRDAYHNTSPVMIPAALQDSVQAVLGLDNVHLSHIFAVRANSNKPPLLPAGANTSHPLVTGTAAAHNPLDFPKIYSASSLPTASTVTVGNVVSGQMSDVLSDIKSFESTNGLPALVPTIEGTGNTGAVSASGDGEWDLDTQDILAMTGGVKSLILYDAKTLSDSALTTIYNLAVTDNKAVAINVSLGECETDAKSAGTTTAEDTIFEQAVAQGQTFSVSSGDSGANECTSGVVPSWPASSQYVMSVGGTKLYTSGTTWASEVVWNDAGQQVDGATGGSPSTFEPMPSWQSGIGQNAGHTTRGVPDVAMDASYYTGALVTVDGKANTEIGGTSLASPLFVGAWARIQGANGGALGFAAPLIYKAAAANYAADFHDVTSGNNTGETAATGWDYTTGFGTLIVSALSGNITSTGGGGGTTGGTPVANFSDTISNLAVTFTDSSTDTGGTLSAHSWTFGDGSTSTATSPSHTYAAAGTYSVTETVTDSASGKTSAKTASVTVTAAGGGTPTQLIVNGGFETGAATPWTLSSGTLCSNSSCSGEVAHAGTYFVWLDGYGSKHTDTASQSVTIPTGKTTATLSYYLHIDTAETGSTAYDKLTVQVLNSSGTVLSTLATYSNVNAATGYTVHTASLAAYIGQKVTIKFTGTEDSSQQTSFVLDDVTLNVQ